MSSMLENNGIDLTGPIDVKWEDAVKFVLAAIGVDKYLLEDPCSITDEVYQGGENGWNNGNILI